jgi:gamma-glutamyl hercynylcysteine S-oxide hydrolase
VCRHLAYVGAPIALDALLFSAPHALGVQAQHARFQTSGTENPDGFGVAWYEPRRRQPHRYRTTTPIWRDAAFRGRADALCGAAVLAAVRLASPGSPVEVSGNAPFVAGEWAFSLNGIVDRYHDGVGDELRALVSPRRRERIEGVTDSEVLFALALDALDAGASPGDALVRVIGAVTTRTTGRLNLLLTDGRRVAATAWGNSLFGLAAPGAPLVASEPLDDDPAWARVPDRSLVELEARAAAGGDVATRTIGAP